MTLQSATKRLVTEQKLSDSVAASTALAIPLTQKGAANGVATLGADGKLTLAQNPGALYAYLSTSPALSSDNSMATILSFTGVATGVYEVEAHVLANNTSTFQLAATAGTATAAGLRYAASSTGAAAAPPNPAGASLGVGVSVTAASLDYTLTGTITVTATATIALQAGSGFTGRTLLPGTRLRLTKIA